MLFPALDISTSGMTAQRARMMVRSSNLANISTTVNEQGAPDPYKPRFVVFQSDDINQTTDGAVGVRVASVETSQKDPLLRWDPRNPAAIKTGPHAGMVAYPDINVLGEMTDAMEAVRSYEANLGVFEMTRDLAEQTLRILA